MNSLKYVAFACDNKHIGGISGVKDTVEEAREWAREHFNKKNNISEIYIAEVIERAECPPKLVEFIPLGNAKIDMKALEDSLKENSKAELPKWLSPSSE